MQHLAGKVGAVLDEEPHAQVRLALLDGTGDAPRGPVEHAQLHAGIPAVERPDRVRRERSNSGWPTSSSSFRT
jgi:hypothetical protein